MSTGQSVRRRDKGRGSLLVVVNFYISSATESDLLSAVLADAELLVSFK